MIHNSPYAAAATVDVYINGALAIDDLDFQAAIPFTELPAGVELVIDITAPDAADNSAPVFTKTLTLQAGGTYVVVAAGSLDPGAVEGTSFDLFAAAGREGSAAEGGVDLQLFHGASDAPAVDVVVPDVLTLSDDLAFGSFEPYQTVPEGDYQVNVTTADGSTLVAIYTAPLETLGLADSALVVLASGYLSPPEDGAGFALVAALPSGGALVELPVVSGVSVEEPAGEVPGAFTLHGNYPNPFNPSTTVSFDLPTGAQVGLEVYDLLGRRVLSVPVEAIATGAGRSIRVDASSLSSGLYLYRV